MKKLVLGVIAFASLCLDASATKMCVERNDGTIVRYDVDSVKQVYFEDFPVVIPVDSVVQGVSVDGKVGDYTYVDLGLNSGILWATYNVGATLPTEYGDYFAWGETSPKEDYSWKTYKWCDGT